jgi:uncharacterized SAM-binding protein YcdF (DUF218 family)
MMRAKFWLAAIPLLLCLIAGAWIFVGPMLLVRDGPPVAADMIVVLGGDGTGRRIMKGAELAREHFAPAVLVDNSHSYYGYTESELGADFAVQNGYSPDLFIRVRWTASSTVEEAGHVVEELRTRGAHKVIVVTTLWHTARAGRIFRRLAPELEIHMVGVDDPRWRNGHWWATREGQKDFFLETAKTIADFLRI